MKAAKPLGCSALPFHLIFALEKHTTRIARSARTDRYQFFIFLINLECKKEAHIASICFLINLLFPNLFSQDKQSKTTIANSLKKLLYV